MDPTELAKGIILSPDHYLRVKNFLDVNLIRRLDVIVPEVEFRFAGMFGDSTREELVVPLEREAFMGLRRRLNSTEMLEAVEDTTDEAWNVETTNDYRTTCRITTSADHPGHVTAIAKTTYMKSTDVRDGKPNILSGEFTPYRTRLSVNSERRLSLRQIEPIVEVESCERVSPIIKRHKIRSIYNLENGELHLTEVEQSTLTKKDGKFEEGLKTSRYEVELEISTNPFPSYEIVVNLALRVWQLLHLSPVPYSLKDVERISKIYGTNVPWNTSSSIRNFHYEDLEIGGIVGHKGANYYVGPKADGETRMLVFTDNEVWYFFPKGIKSNMSLSRPGFYLPDAPLIQLILEGELVRLKNNPRQEIYLAYDCLFFQNAMLMENYQTRRKFARIAIRMLQHPNIHLKDAILFTTVSEFFDATKQMLQQMYPYNTDGLIFTPNGPYLTEGTYPEGIPIGKGKPSDFNREEVRKGKFHEDRTLTQTTDITKWKPLESLTIDFRVAFDRGFPVLRIDSGRGREIPFDIKTKSRPFTQPKMIDAQAIIAMKVKNNDIVEFRWDRGTEKMIPIGFRDDKTKPNSLIAARNTWHDINDLITRELLLGESIDLMVKYHNVIKLSLYQKISLLTEKRHQKILLDIGSGRGGDINKWTVRKDDSTEWKFDKIFAVEPNSEFRTEFKNRLENFPDKEVVTLIPTSGENTETVVKAMGGMKADVISLMLSMSFFEESEGKYEGFIETIKQCLKSDGYIIFLTIDGDAVDQFFKYKPGSARLSGVELTYNGYKQSLFYKTPRTGGTIEEEGQTEYPPHLTRFLAELENLSPRKAIFQRSLGKKILSSGEQQLSRLYTSGIISFDQTEWRSFISILPAKEIGTGPQYTMSEDGTETGSEALDTEASEAESTEEGSEILDEDQDQEVETIGHRPKVYDVISLFPLSTIDWERRTTTLNKYQILGTEQLGGVPGKRIARLATINLDDGENVYHAILQALYPEYRKVSLIERISLVRTFKKELIERIRNGGYDELLKAKGSNTIRNWYGAEYQIGSSKWSISDAFTPILGHRDAASFIRILESRDVRLAHLVPVLRHFFNVGTITLSDPGKPRYMYGVKLVSTFVAFYVHYLPDGSEHYETVAEALDTQEILTMIPGPRRTMSTATIETHIVQLLAYAPNKVRTITKFFPPLA